MKFKDQAIHEAIYWWCRDEYFLHQVLSNLDNEIKTLGKQFVEEKVIGYFLRLYSVRRTIQKGEEGVTKFTREISSTGFYKRVMEDDCKALEEFVSQFSAARGEGSIKSALSKLATLCNPSKFVMFDSRSRCGMHRIYNGLPEDKITYKQIDDYNQYSILSAKLAEYFPEEFLKVALASYKETEAINYLNCNIDVLRLRCIDKLLWLHGGKVDPKPIPVQSYIRAADLRG